MAQFFVGQRVRIKWSNGWPELAGEEGRITAAIDRRFGNYGSDCEWEVAPDCWGSSMAPIRTSNGANCFAPNSRQLEPIVPEGAKPSTMSFEELMDSLQVQEISNPN